MKNGKGTGDRQQNQLGWRSWGIFLVKLFPVFQGGRLAILILVAHLALGVLYSVLVPIWEAHDEWAHYNYIAFVAKEHRLPQPGQQIITKHEPPESFQPPLYYILGALATFWIDTDDGLRPVINPYAFTGTGEGGVNVAVHSEEEEAFPYRGTVLAVHVARLVSVLLSTAAVWATYLTACLIFPNRREIALGAMAFHAFAPEFLFIGSVVSNDIMAITVSSFLLLLTVKVVVKGLRFADLLALVLGLGLGILSKYTALALIPVVGLGVVIALIREAKMKGSLRPLLRWGGAFVLLVAGWWLLVSVPWSKPLVGRYLGPLQGYILGLRRFISNLPQLPWHLLSGGLLYAFYTFWGSFGWGNVGVEAWVYWAFACISAIGFLGFVLFMFRKFPSPLAKLASLVLLIDVLFAIALPAYRELLLERELTKGRYILVAIPAVSLLLVSGFSQWVPRRFSKALIAALSLFLLALALITPFRYILPAYARPPLLSEADVGELQHPLYVNFDDKAELLGYDAGRERVKVGEAIAITLYWRALAEMERNYTVAVKVMGQDNQEYQEYGGLNIYPGRGNFATSLWRAGDIFSETYWVPVSANAPAPSLARIYVALFLDSPELEHLPTFDPQGQPIGWAAIFGRLKLRPREQREYTFATPVRFELDGQVALIGYEIERFPTPGEAPRLKLYWQALKKMDEDYTVFVHLLDGEGRLRT